MPRLRAVFSVTELAQMAGISRHAMSRMLKATAVPIRRTGHKRHVFLSDLRIAMPYLWQSMRDLRSLAPVPARARPPICANCAARAKGEGTK